MGRSSFALTEAPAIIASGSTTSYAELADRSARVAAVLRDRGVGIDRVVAVVAERGPAQIIGLVAVLRAGGVYLPIKPDLPAQRIAWMIADAAPVAILCDGPPPEALAGVEVIRIDLPLPTATIAPVEVPADALAYIVYTSGSTGRPKGVMVTRRALDTQIAWTRTAFGFGAGDRMIQLASSVFDYSLVEMLTPLAAGGAVIVPSDLDPLALAALADQHRATVVHFVPSLFRVVLEACKARPWLGVTTVLCGGEAVTLDLVRTCRSVFPNAKLYNQYGPTETGVIATYWLTDPAADHVAIGSAVTGVTTHVIDGELWLGGEKLARGYLHRPDLTAERFVPDPFAAEPGARMYRTGDQVRERRDGLEFLGRSDFQVKIRGVRIELGEIEAQLARHPGVREAVVVAREDEPGDKRLVAYVVGGGAVASLRETLRAALPEYMIPSAFVKLDALPLTTNGKLDRNALPAPVAEARQLVVPRTQPEIELARIWRDELGIAVGIADNFFELGGHSLLAIRVAARARDALGVAVTQADLFAAPTIAALAERLRGAGTARAVAKSADRTQLALVQQRLWFLDQLDPASRAYNISAAYRLHGVLDVAALARAFGALIERHEVLRTVFPAVDGVPRAEIQPARPFVLPVEDASEAEAARRAEQGALERFDLARGPLVRARLLRLTPVDHVLALDIHHIVFDGWSSRVMWLELPALYRGEALPDLPLQYADYAAWSRGHEVAEDRLAAWTAELAGAPADLALPYNGPRPATHPFRGGNIELVLEPALATALGRLAARSGTTPYMVMLAAWRVLIARYTGESDLCIGTAVADRDHRGVENLVGFFVNTLVLRGRIERVDRFSDVLARETEHARAAYTRQDVPFERIVDALGIPRAANRMPLIQVLCIDHGDVSGDGALPDLTTEPFRIELAVTDADLILIARERHGRRELALTYAEALFEREVIVAMARSYVALLRSRRRRARTAGR